MPGRKAAESRHFYMTNKWWKWSEKKRRNKNKTQNFIVVISHLFLLKCLIKKRHIVRWTAVSLCDFIDGFVWLEKREEQQQNQAFLCANYSMWKWALNNNEVIEWWKTRTLSCIAEVNDNQGLRVVFLYVKENTSSISMNHSHVVVRLIDLIYMENDCVFSILFFLFKWLSAMKAYFEFVCWTIEAIEGFKINGIRRLREQFQKWINGGEPFPPSNPLLHEAIIADICSF